MAEEARDKAEEKQKYEEVHKEVNRYRAQNNTLFSAVSENQEKFTAKTHLVKTNAIRNNISTLASELGIESHRELGAISVATDKILSALKYSALAKFNIEDEYIEADTKFGLIHSTFRLF